MFSSMTINFEGSGTYCSSVYLDEPQKNPKIQERITSFWAKI